MIATLGERLLPRAEGIDWQAMRKTSTIREWIGKTVPGFEKIRDIDRTHEEFQIAGRTFHQPRFATADGRGVMHLHELPELKGTGDAELRLMTVRSEGQFNTVVYEEEDLYRNQTRRDVILLHSDDLTRLGIAHGQSVTVVSDTGRMSGIVVQRFDAIRSGNALMYYPEANELVARRADPNSRTPAFKGVVVWIET